MFKIKFFKEFIEYWCKVRAKVNVLVIAVLESVRVKLFILRCFQLLDVISPSKQLWPCREKYILLQIIG